MSEHRTCTCMFSGRHDHQNGIFAGTNDLVEKLGGRPPMALESFIEKHRAAFI